MRDEGHGSSGSPHSFSSLRCRIFRSHHPRRINRKRTLRMALPEFTMRQLLEAGVHFGHQTKRWNPKMRPFIYGSKNGIHIIDLQKTARGLIDASRFVTTTVSKGGAVLFVGTKRAARDIVAEEASRAGMFYVNNRWLGGTLTNWATVKK